MRRAGAQRGQYCALCERCEIALPIGLPLGLSMPAALRLTANSSPTRFLGLEKYRRPHTRNHRRPTWIWLSGAFLCAVVHTANLGNSILHPPSRHLFSRCRKASLRQLGSTFQITVGPVSTCGIRPTLKCWSAVTLCAFEHRTCAFRLFRAFAGRR